MRLCSGAVLAAATLALPLLAAAQTPPAKPAAAASGPLATVNGVAISRQRADVIVRERTQQGAPDNEQLRNAVRDELINREVIVQEASRLGMTKKPDLLLELELVKQSYIVQAYLRDWVRQHPVSDAEIQREYERARVQTGDREYRARHILVATEDEAKSLIAELKKGAKFEDLAQKHTKDEGTKPRGGDLDWNVPSVFDKTFAEAMVKLQKGQMSETPVRTRFGYHVVRLEDVRAVNFPPLDKVKAQILQRLTQQRIEEMIRGLRAKARIE
jgi:peptidyl-prolyl cis-trans isomerase C